MKRTAYIIITPTRVAAFSSCALREKFIRRFAQMFPCMVEPELPKCCWQTGPRIKGWEVTNTPLISGRRTSR